MKANDKFSNDNFLQLIKIICRSNMNINIPVSNKQTNNISYGISRSSTFTTQKETIIFLDKFLDKLSNYPIKILHFYNI